MKKMYGMIFILLNLFFAAYFLTYPFDFFPQPDFLVSYHSWIVFAGGLLIFFGLFSYLSNSRNRRKLKSQ